MQFLEHMRVSDPVPEGKPPARIPVRTFERSPKTAPSPVRSSSRTRLREYHDIGSRRNTETCERLTPKRKESSITSRASIAATVIALLALPTACGDDGPTGPRFSTVTGTWIGTEFEITFTFELVEDEAGEIRGPVDMIMGDDVVHAMVVSGRREGAHVVLVVGAQGFRNSTFRGDLSDDGTMVLGVSGFGFRGEDEFRLVLQRQTASGAIASASR